jgi:hypothetical protein
MLERRVGGDAGAKERRGTLERNAFGNSKHVVLIDGDASRIAAIGRRRLAVALIAVIGQRHAAFAKLLLASEAGRAGTVGIDEAADTDDVTLLPFAHMGADIDDLPDDLVARDHGKD